MKFFIDTANLKEIKDANDLGILDGVTTNPSLVAKEGIEDFHAHVKKICSIVSGPVSAEVTTLTSDEMYAQGKVLAKLADNVVVKIPLTTEGLKTIKKFHSEGIKTNCTLCFSATQALLAAKAGASFISPFVGRLDDISTDGMELIQQIVQIYDNYGYETEVLVASVRHPLHIVEAALMGAHVATIPFKVIEQLAKHPLTDLGLAKFMEDAKKFDKPLAHA
jgi:transaldolase